MGSLLAPLTKGAPDPLQGVVPDPLQGVVTDPLQGVVPDPLQGVPTDPLQGVYEPLRLLVPRSPAHTKSLPGGNPCGNHCVALSALSLIHI